MGVTWAVRSEAQCCCQDLTKGLEFKIKTLTFGLKITRLHGSDPLQLRHWFKLFHILILCVVVCFVNFISFHLLYMKPTYKKLK